MLQWLDVSLAHQFLTSIYLDVWAPLTHLPLKLCFPRLAIVHQEKMSTYKSECSSIQVSFKILKDIPQLNKFRYAYDINIQEKLHRGQWVTVPKGSELNMELMVIYRVQRKASCWNRQLYISLWIFFKSNILHCLSQRPPWKDAKGFWLTCLHTCYTYTLAYLFVY